MIYHSLKVRRINGNISVDISCELEAEALQQLAAPLQRYSLRPKITTGWPRQLQEANELVFLCIALDDLICLVGRAVTHDDPPLGQHGLAQHARDGSGNKGFFVVGGRHEDITSSRSGLPHVHGILSSWELHQCRLRDYTKSKLLGH